MDFSIGNTFKPTYGGQGGKSFDSIDASLGGQGEMAGAIGKGAAVGGPWGAVAGAALGAVQSVQKKRKEARDQYNSNLDSIAAALSAWG
jgi:hypothetical protein